jgi:hypothetical protein
MRTHLAVTRPVDGDAWPVVERFMRSPLLWLPPPARPAHNQRDVVSTARLGPFLHAIRLQVGPPWNLTDAAVRRLSWVPCDVHGEPVHTTSLPSFTGRLTVRHADDAVFVALTGWYEPPGGVLGAAFDRALLHRSGEATARALLEDVATRLQAPADEEQPR